MKKKRARSVPAKTIIALKLFQLQSETPFYYFSIAQGHNIDILLFVAFPEHVGNLLQFKTSRVSFRSVYRGITLIYHAYKPHRRKGSAITFPYVQIYNFHKILSVK